MLGFKLAYRNLIGAGLRTWLNVIVLSFSFVVIIWHKGLLEGWNQQARKDMIAWQIGGGVYWHENYDPYDPFTLQDSHGKITSQIQNEIAQDKLTPILIEQAIIYPDGRMQSVLMKGIDPRQTILELPSTRLYSDIEEVPVMIGSRMAKNNRLEVGDFVTVRWRDANGVFDAAEAKIVKIFKSNVPAIDNGQIWIPIERLWTMTKLNNEATILIVNRDYVKANTFNGWNFKDHDFLLAEMDQIIHQKSVGGSILYVILLFLAMLAIFDTQVLSIFRRQKEIGTHLALGMTRGQVIKLFTIEGAMHSVLAAIVAAIYGIPLLSIQAIRGFSIPIATDDYGLASAERIFPNYSAALVIGTILIVLITATIVSYLPTRKIAKMKPTEALKGKIQ